MISVIVPIYNVEKYIHTCIISLLKQTYNDYEIILVDDGSPDQCPDICDQYASQHTNIRVLHNKNGGLSAARNAGTCIASGEYVTYIDSDDYVSDEYLETLWNLIKKNNADIAVTGIKVFFENKKVKNQKEKIKEFCYTNFEALENMLYQNNIDTSACAMLIPIQIAKANPFPIRKFHEDEFTTYKYYISAEKIAITTKEQYFYLQRKGSIMHTFGQASIDELDAADNLFNECGKLSDQLRIAANAKKFSDYCQVLLSVGVNNNSYIYNRIMDFLMETKSEMIKNSKVRKKNKIAAILLYGGVRPLFFVNKFLKKVIEDNV